MDINLFVTTDTVLEIDEALPLDKATDILDELIEAQNQSYVLGLKLKIKLHDVDAIHSKDLDPKVRLLQIT